MQRPNRIGPWMCGDIEVPPWVPGATLLGVLDGAGSTPPVIGGGVRSVTAPLITNFEHWSLNTTTMVTGAYRQFGLGCLISGVNPDPTNNIIYAITGMHNTFSDEVDEEFNTFPIIAKLDATPSDPDALIIITDYVPLPMTHHNFNFDGKAVSASVNTQVVVGDVRGSTASQSNLPIFVGWIISTDANTDLSWSTIGSISVQKYLEDIVTQDPQR